ncbi:unnamed protein product, partial [Cylicostephanus goldi]
TWKPFCEQHTTACQLTFCRNRHFEEPFIVKGTEMKKHCFRAAYLTAAGISQVLNRMNRPFKVTVGIDGSVYRFHPFFKRLLEEKINVLITKGVRYQLMLSKDGSGIGAAVVAAVATRMRREKERKRA